MKDATVALISSLPIPNDCYIYSLEAVPGNLASICSDDSLQILDPETLKVAPTGSFHRTHSGVTCLKKSHSGQGDIVTAGRDGFVRCWDLRTHGKTWEFKDENSTPLLSLAVCRTGTTVAVGTELSHSEASVQVWDYRSLNRPITKYRECHNDDVTELSFHPTQASCLLSGSTDGLVNIYNTLISDEDDALNQVMNHGASISHAGFLTSTTVYALSHDEVFSLYHLTLSEDQDDDQVPTVFGDLRPRTDCEYIVDILPINGQAVIAAGTHSKSRLHLLPLRPILDWEVEEQATVSLNGAHGEEIVRCIYVDSQSGTIYTGGEDGVVKAWKEKPMSDRPSRIGPSKQKERDRALKDKHYKPY